jgi:hypothetical protein
MKTLSVSLSRTVLTSILGGVALLGTAQAQISSHSKDVVIEQPANLPELAQTPGIAFQLYTESGDGSAYLYIEQQEGKRLTVLDVTNPGHVKIVRAVDLSVPGPFDFAQDLGTSSILIRFRDNLGAAGLDLHKAKMPVLRTFDSPQYTGRFEPLDQAIYLMIEDRVFDQERTPRDDQVIDTSNPAHPTPLYSARLVFDSITRDETGTTFLLGSDGLTIIRPPQIEQEYAADQRATN